MFKALYFNQNNENYEGGYCKIQKKLKRILPIIFTLSLLMTLVAPVAAFDPDPENFKFFKMEVFGASQYPVTESIFSTEKATLFTPYYPQNDDNIL